MLKRWYKLQKIIFWKYMQAFSKRWWYSWYGLDTQVCVKDEKKSLSSESEKAVTQYQLCFSASGSQWPGCMLFLAQETHL